MGELEAIRRRHLLETADGNCAGSYSWDPEGWHRPQGHDLDLAVEDIGKLLAEVERLRGVVGLLREARAWWPRDPHSPDVPRMNPAAPFLEAIDAALAALEAGE